ncbi:MAG TPA: hypothetical protein PK373_08110 [Sedimentisphaerales bacterium]|nr:hypothetical protein [Sedimentisphaerales bacterium]HQG49037.1 hypothetical protein [Sedimentisphaerales bacterium]HQI29105.1 hypothetical protein [Sedimentisphaerales bacterium]
MEIGDPAQEVLAANSTELGIPVREEWFRGLCFVVLGGMPASFWPGDQKNVPFLVGRQSRVAKACLIMIYDDTNEGAIAKTRNFPDFVLQDCHGGGIIRIVAQWSGMGWEKTPDDSPVLSLERARR